MSSTPSPVKMPALLTAKFSSPKIGNEFLDHLFCLIRLGDVADIGLHLASGFLSNFFRRGRSLCKIDIHNADLSAQRCESVSEACADP